MATVRKILGQLVPAAANTEIVYTVPADTEAVVSSIMCANLATSSDQFSVGIVAEADGALGLKNIVYYNIPIGGNNTFVATVGITLAAGDSVHVLSNAGSMSFSVFGQEITA
jgi:hypothetical protein